MEKHIKKYIHIVSLLALGILFYALNANVPLRNDDLMYSFMYLRECVGNVPHPIDLNAPIDGIGDVFVSQLIKIYLISVHRLFISSFLWG